MPSLSGQHSGGLVLPDELKEPMSLPDILRNTSFVSASGRAYHLFGNEENTFSIPPSPLVLAASKPSALTLEEALQQIESFSSQITNDNNVADNSVASEPTPPVRASGHMCPSAESPMLHLFQALNDATAPRLLKRGSPNLSPKPKEEKAGSLRIVAAPVEEPFIVPFAKPETVPEETTTQEKPVTLKIVAKPKPPIRLQKIIRKVRQRREKALYRKGSVLPTDPAHSASHATPTQCGVNRADDSDGDGNSDSNFLVDSPLQALACSGSATFRWSEQLDSLMRTAENQIRCLADHLVVQVNQGVKAICFKSVFPGDGCSTILLCAVRALMERHYRVLLIDAHYQHIDLPKQLDVSPEVATGGEVIHLNDHLDLWVWQETKTAAENRTILTKILADHREEYDMILFDNGSVTESPLTELIEFWDQVELDGIILVTNTKRPEEMPLCHIARRLRQHHLHLIGITENYV